VDGSRVVSLDTLGLIVVVILVMTLVGWLFGRTY
jgi:hypothetical protein